MTPAFLQVTLQGLLKKIKLKVSVPICEARVCLAFIGSCYQLPGQATMFFRASSLLAPFEDLVLSFRGPSEQACLLHLLPHLHLFVRVMQISTACLEKQREQQAPYRLLPLLSRNTMYSLHAPFLPFCLSFTLLKKGPRPPPCLGPSSENHSHTLEGLQHRG